MVWKTIEPGGLPEILQAIPARKMVQLTKLPSIELLPLVCEVSGNTQAKAPTCLRQANLVKIAHNICADRFGPE